MKVIVVGATGTIGSAVTKAIKDNHEVIPVSYSKSTIKVDIADKSSIKKMFEATGKVDAVICAAGLAKFAPLSTLSDQDIAFCLNNKLMGQVNLIRLGMDHINDNGSITVTSGILSHSPTQGSAAISMVNAGLEGFVRAAALETERGIRVNAVSPNWVIDTLKIFNMDPSIGTPVEVVAQAYVKSLEGSMSGEVIEADE